MMDGILFNIALAFIVCVLLFSFFLMPSLGDLRITTTCQKVTHKDTIEGVK